MHIMASVSFVLYRQQMTRILLLIVSSPEKVQVVVIISQYCATVSMTLFIDDHFSLVVSLYEA
jgi:hypothetical protein